MSKKTLKILLCLGMLSSAVAFNASAMDDRSSADAVSEKTKAAIEEMKHYSADRKDEAAHKAKEIIADLDHRIQVLEDKIADKKNDLSDSARAASEKTLIKLKEKRHTAQDWYAKFKDSSKDAWEEIKNGFIKSYEAFQDTYNS